MMKRRYLLIALLIFSFNINAQTSKANWRSSDRFSVRIESDYFFNSWDKYNSVTSHVADIISTELSYENPNGSFEKINGDAGVTFFLNYEIINSFSVSLGYGTNKISSDFIFTNQFTNFDGTVGNTLVFQKTRFDLDKYLLGISYKIKAIKSINVVPSVSINHFSGEYKVSNYFSRLFGGGIPTLSDDSTPDILSLNQSKLGWSGSIALEVPIFSKVTFSMGATYRNIVFDDLSNTFFDIAQDEFISIERKIGLVESDNYFGLGMDNVDPIINYQFINGYNESLNPVRQSTLSFNQSDYL